MRTLAVLMVLACCASAAWAQSGDPCEVMPKNNVAIAITTATTTQLVAPVAGQAVYVCGLTLTMAAATSIQFEYGTGASCTGTHALTGVIPPAQINPPSNNATQFVTPVAQGVCAVSTGTAGIHGSMSYIQW